MVPPLCAPLPIAIDFCPFHRSLCLVRREASLLPFLAAGPITSRSLHTSGPLASPHPPFDVASPLEAIGMILPNPGQLASQILETTHAVSGLPWWASIPVVALAARAALLPLTIKAKAASANLPLLQNAFTQANGLGLQIDAGYAEASRAAASPEEASSSATTTSTHAPPSAGANKIAAFEKGAAKLGRLALTQHILSTTRQREGVPSFNWYLLNGGVQVGAGWNTLKHLLSLCTSHLDCGLQASRQYRLQA